MAVHDPDDVERRIRAGQWVSTTELAALFGRDRTTVYRWAKKKLLRSRMSPGGGELECNPEDAVAMLDRWRGEAE